MNVWHLVLCVVILALAYIFFQYARIRKLPEGTDEMQEMAGIIRDGASTFLKTEFRVIAIVVIVVAAVFSLFVEKTSGITFIMGACMSSVVCILGMRSATYANVRTSNRARETLVHRRDRQGRARAAAASRGLSGAGVRHAGHGPGPDHLERRGPDRSRHGLPGQP